MNNLLNFKPVDEIIDQLESSIDKESAMKTLAFQYFKNDMNALVAYVDHPNMHKKDKQNLIEPRAQLEFSF